MELPSSKWDDLSLLGGIDSFPSERETDVEHKSTAPDASSSPAPLVTPARDASPPPAPLAPPVPPARASIAVARVSLADLLASRMQMQWFEVVAVAQGVSHAVLQTAGAAEPTAPQLSDVALTSLGTVEISAGVPAADSPILFVRGILHALPENKPVQLRLFVLQLDSPSHIATLRDLSTALEYFERPGRSELIRAVVNRYLANGLAPLEPRPDVEQPKTTSADKAKSLDSRWRPWLAAAVVVAAAASMFGMGYWLLNGTRGTKSRTPVSVSLRTALAATRSVAAGNLQALGERIGLVSAPAKSDAVVGKEPLRQPRARAARGRHEAALETRTASGDVFGAPPPTVVGAPPPTADAPHEAASSVDELSHDVSTVEIGAVYDSRDADVTPPIELWPHVPTLRSGITPANIATFELVIDEAGAVESARAYVPLKRWDHVMLMSAMKAWRFRPATKDGHPVKYRQQVLVAVPMY